MDTLGTGLALVINGLLTLGGELAGWHTLLGVLLLLSLVYLATVEIAELDRSSSKPQVERH